MLGPTAGTNATPSPWPATPGMYVPTSSNPQTTSPTFYTTQPPLYIVTPDDLTRLADLQFDSGQPLGFAAVAAVCQACAAVIYWPKGGAERHRANCEPPLPKTRADRVDAKGRCVA